MTRVQEYEGISKPTAKHLKSMNRVPEQYELRPVDLTFGWLQRIRKAV